jgi:hypothetical protein
MEDTSYLQARIIEEFLRRVNAAPDLDAGIKDRMAKLATTKPERVKVDHVRMVILGEGDVK